jgi:hypothetical protein
MLFGYVLDSGALVRLRIRGSLDGFAAIAFCTLRGGRRIPFCSLENVRFSYGALRNEGNFVPKFYAFAKRV